MALLVVTHPMCFIYPQSGTTLYLPRQLSGEVESAVFRLAPPVGKQSLIVVDDGGNSLSIVFTVAE